MKRPHVLCVVALLLVTTACGPRDREQDDADPTQDGAGSARPTVAVTHWTDLTELFLEYPTLVAGEPGRAAIHVTKLADFTPLAEGEAVVVLRPRDGAALEFRGTPSRPGIFGADVRLERPGVYDMALRIEAPELRDVHELGPVTVLAPGEPRDGAEEEGEAISFLKEQQWALDFGTTPVEVRPMRTSLVVPAAVRARPGGEAVLAAPVPGRIDPASRVPVPGTAVRSGAALARIIPRSDDLRDEAALRAELVETEQAHDLAVRERDRVERLVDAEALPSRRLDEARATLVAAAARLSAARERWSRFEAVSQSGAGESAGAGFIVRAPFGGVVSEVRFAPGATVEENEVLVRIVDPDSVHVVGAVPESSAAGLGQVEAGELLLEGEPPLDLSRPLSVGRVVEPVARTTEVRFALDNRSARLPVGQSVQLRLFVGAELSAAAIPESAIVDDAGRPVVFVQAAGESFERRPVRLGNRAEGWVQVVEGVEPGERVVHRGAYLVRLAALSPQIPSHGHVH